MEIQFQLIKVRFNYYFQFINKPLDKYTSNCNYGCSCDNYM